MRSRSTDRCIRCRMYRPLCLCSFLQPLRIATRVVILMHYREQRTTTNTARLAQLALADCELRVRGLQEQRLETSGILEPGRQALLLYPAAGATTLSREWIQQLGRPITLIVPDGSWRQASKIGKREPGLAQVPWVKLPAAEPSAYRLRKEPYPESLCTFEAISRSLGIIEGPEVRRELDRLFETMVERVLWSRGLLPVEECKTPIPQAAIDASHEAGARGGLISQQLRRERQARCADSPHSSSRDA